MYYLSADFFIMTDEVDEIEVYGSEAQSGTQLATYSFEVSESNSFSCCFALYDLLVSL